MKNTKIFNRKYIYEMICKFLVHLSTLAEKCIFCMSTTFEKWELEENIFTLILEDRRNKTSMALCLVSFSYFAVHGINHVTKSAKVASDKVGNSLGIRRSLCFSENNADFCSIILTK